MGGTREHTIRLDLEMVARGLTDTRSRARDLIRHGTVLVNGVAASKPSTPVSNADAIALSEEAWSYVSRSALKLIAALDHFGIDVAGRAGLDIGASTGGFTQVLLERGATMVTAIDVGHDQLHKSLRNDPRVQTHQGLDARDLTQEHLSGKPDLLVADVSFISLTKALAVPMDLMPHNADMIALIKPQFEVGRKALGAGGIVRDETARLRAVEAVCQWVADRPSGWQVRGTIPSPVTGQQGNQEYLVWASKP